MSLREFRGESALPQARLGTAAARVRTDGGGWGDVRGGVAAATMTLVTALSYAAVAGAPLGSELAPAVMLAGLIGATLGGAVAALWGSAPGQMFSPRASVAVVIASAIATLDPRSYSGEGLAWLTACLLLAAVLQWSFGALRLGGLIRLIPHSVTAGLTIGIAADMAWSQLPHWWPTDGVHGWAQAVPLAVGSATVAAIACSQWQGWRGAALPLGVAVGVLAHMALSTAWPAGALLHMPSLDLQALELPNSPLLSLSALIGALEAGAAIQHLPSLAGFALAIAFVNSLETLTSTVVLEDAAQRRFDANNALVAGALGSIVAVCAGGWPVAGGAATSMVSVKAGARTRGAALIAAGVLVALAVIFCRWLSLVPMAAVAGLMLTVAFALGHAPVRDLLRQRNTTSALRGAARCRPAGLSADTAVAALVCALVLTGGIVSAVLGGVVAAAALLVMQMRRTLVRRRYDASHADALAHLDADFDASMSQRIQIVEVAQPLFFATADAVVQVIDKLPRTTRYAIVDLSHIGAIDATAARVLSRCGAALRLRGCRLVLVSSQPESAFVAADEAHAPCKVFASLPQALRFSARRYGSRAEASPVVVDLSAHSMRDEQVSAQADHAVCPTALYRAQAPQRPSMAERKALLRDAPARRASATQRRALPTQAGLSALQTDDGLACDRPPEPHRRLHLVRNP